MQRKLAFIKVSNAVDVDVWQKPIVTCVSTWTKLFQCCRFGLLPMLSRRTILYKNTNELFTANDDYEQQLAICLPSKTPRQQWKSHSSSKLFTIFPIPCLFHRVLRYVSFRIIHIALHGSPIIFQTMPLAALKVEDWDCWESPVARYRSVMTSLRAGSMEFLLLHDSFPIFGPTNDRRFSNLSGDILIYRSSKRFLDSSSISANGIMSSANLRLFSLSPLNVILIYLRQKYLLNIIVK